MKFPKIPYRISNAPLISFRISNGVWIIGFTVILFLGMLTLAPFTHAQNIENPIDATSFEQLITSVADAVTEIALVLAGVAIIFAGFKFLVAGATGDEKGLATAKKMFFWVLIGTA